MSSASGLAPESARCHERVMWRCRSKKRSRSPSRYPLLASSALYEPDDGRSERRLSFGHGARDAGRVLVHVYGVTTIDDAAGVNALRRDNVGAAPDPPIGARQDTRASLSAPSGSSR